MFSLPRSSWQDYDKSLISLGGGVFSRSLKAIPLALEVRALLDLDKPQATPSEVVTAILKARVDLLWFGGIGTYIRAAGESDDQVGDRANDPIRVTGADVRARVIGEGANLGTTQRGRIEAAQKGIKLKHRRHRQFGRGQHLRRRGQSQDRGWRAPNAMVASEPERPQQPACRDDRRSRHVGGTQQLSADAGAFAGRTQGPGRDPASSLA